MRTSRRRFASKTAVETRNPFLDVFLQSKWKFRNEFPVARVGDTAL